MDSHIPMFRSGIGQCSHRFLPTDSSKPCIIGGIIFEGVPGLDSDSDGDVVFHAMCNAITSLSSIPILHGIARDLSRKDGITDSEVFLEKAIQSLAPQKIVHVSITLEGKRPRFEDRIDLMRDKISKILHIAKKEVGITFTSGEGLTDFGCGDGLQCFVLITTYQDQ